MTTATMNSEKISLAQAILAIDNPETLTKVMNQVYIVLGNEKSVNLHKHIPSLSYDELRARLSQAAEDAKAGNVFACEDVHRSLEEKYPWLCE